MILGKKDHQSLETLIGAETSIEGNLSTTGTVRIDGAIDGAVKADWILVGDRGAIKGDVVARGILIAGKVEGAVKANESVEIRSKAVVEGDVYTGKLSIAEGACFDGYCYMRHAAEAEGKRSLSLEPGGKKSGRSLIADTSDDR
jgi:cytoskeletal protein CcmA (bactofilin family)